MRRPAALFPIVFALGALIFVSGAGAQEPAKITACQTISQPGSYRLANNLPAIPPGLPCLVITANFVSIDLGGFSMTGSSTGEGGAGTGVLAQGQLQGIAVRNGSISGYTPSVNLGSADGSIVEGLRVSGLGVRGSGIIATGIVKGNTATDFRFTAIEATGTVTGNYVSGYAVSGISVGPGSTVTGNNVSGSDGINAISVATGSTVIGNTATGTGSGIFGINVACPSNVIDNTSTGHSHNLVLSGNGCNNSNNVAP
jgi:hypothetical protein